MSFINPVDRADTLIDANPGTYRNDSAEHEEAWGGKLPSRRECQKFFQWALMALGPPVNSEEYSIKFVELRAAFFDKAEDEFDEVDDFDWVDLDVTMVDYQWWCWKRGVKTRGLKEE